MITSHKVKGDDSIVLWYIYTFIQYFTISISLNIALIHTTNPTQSAVSSLESISH